MSARDVMGDALFGLLGITALLFFITGVIGYILFGNRT
jgi:hypothetical protein